MPRFRKYATPFSKQAQKVLAKHIAFSSSRHTAKLKLNSKKPISTGNIHSISTFNKYVSSLTQAGEWINRNFGVLRLSDITLDQATQYLDYRSQTGICQKQLNCDRNALSFILGSGNIRGVKSISKPSGNSRAYTIDQIKLIIKSQTAINAFITRLITVTGIRAHEVITLAPLGASIPSKREWRRDRFNGRLGIRYVVTGKGGLKREISIPYAISEKLEQLRLSTPRQVSDRGINYTQHYNLSGGNAWSKSFSAASKRALGFSYGGHGLRFTYAQQRMNELTQIGYLFQNSLAIISQELGHFRPDITLTYLR